MTSLSSAVRWLIKLGVEVAMLPLAFLLMLIVHESGHTLVAWALGDPGASFVLYGRGCLGCNYYDSAGMGALANTAVNLGGVFFTGILTWAGIAAIGWRVRPLLLPRWLALEIIAMTFGFDLCVQVLQAILRPIPETEPLGTRIGYVDFEAAASFFSQATGWAHGPVAAVGLTLFGAYTAAVLAGLLVAWRRGAEPREPAAHATRPPPDDRHSALGEGGRDD